MKIDRWKIYQALGYERLIESDHYGSKSYPVPEVRAFHNSDARIKIVTAPARSGKSWSAAYDVIPDILAPIFTGKKDQDNKILIVGPEYEHASKEFGYIADALVHKGKEIGLPGPSSFYHQPKVGRLEIRWDDIKTWVIGRSARHVHSLLGDQWNAAILSETAQIEERVWLQGLSTRVKRAIWPTTPSVRGRWIKEFYDEAVVQGDENVSHFRFPPWANPYYDKERFDEELARRGPEDPFFREQFLGDWEVFYGGRVYPDFQADRVEDVTPFLSDRGIQGGEGSHCILPFAIPHHWKRVAGIDFGWLDPTVFLFGAVAPNGDLIVYDEYSDNQRSMGDHISTIREMANENGTPWPPEIFREKKGQAKQIAVDIEVDHDLPTMDVDPDRIAGRLRIQEYLTKGENGQPKLRIIKENCPKLVKELLELHYDYQNIHHEGQQEKYLGNDHCADALRYMLMSRPSPRRIRDTPSRRMTLDQLKARHRAKIRHLGKIGQQRLEAYRG